ncbi:hypothetical protein BCR35DRAFT_293884 [Leucosporidium creatinivorum]|uniref:J domain-containing protein n=1 Tax=Leucosporidium creatinivorum TaxID=106004 RepID=A0A1Y2EP64_9BASI|nr:hypothetical protein BCR35DRAFT_293884 [Leucosporidium creatinivorum]
MSTSGFPGLNSDSPDVDEEPFWTSAAPEEHEEDATDTEALYAVLNLPKDCSEEDIQKSYKRLAALLHPDRHPDPALKHAADSRFQELNRAFEVLSDPKQRAVYDELGVEGLKTTWEVGSRHKTPAEMRAEFERLGRKQLEANVENLVRSKGELTVITDARVLFLPDDERRALGGPPQMTLTQKLSTVTTKQLFLKHSFTTPVNPTTSLVLTSQLLARQGVGAGNVLAKVLWNPSSKLSAEIGTTLLRPRALAFKTTYTPDPDTFVTLNMPVKDLIAPPQFTFTLGRRIFEHITGSFTIRSGVWAIGPWGRDALEPVSSSTVSLGLNHTNGWGVEASSGVFAQQVSASYSQTMLGGVKVVLGGVVTSQGAVSTFVSGDRRVTENVRAGMTLDMGVSGVMTVKVRFNRLGQRLTFPVIVSSSWNPTLIASFTVLPAVSIIVANHFVLDPRKRRKVTGRISELRKEHAELIAEKRTEAAEAVALLQEHVRRKVEAERLSNGLVIEEAIYGVLESIGDKTDAEEDQRWLDVTVALQALVTNSQLIIPAGRSKANLLGFFDCAYGEKKRLRVRYSFKGRKHEVELGDLEAIAAPLRSHVVE